MFSEFLQGVGALAIFVIGGSYWFKLHDYRKEVEHVNAQMRHLRERKATHPEDADEIDERLHELLQSMPVKPRVL